MSWLYFKGSHVIDPLSRLARSLLPLGVKGVVCLSGVGIGPDGQADDSLSRL